MHGYKRSGCIDVVVESATEGRARYFVFLSQRHGFNPPGHSQVNIIQYHRPTSFAFFCVYNILGVLVGISQEISPYHSALVYVYVYIYSI